MSSILINKPQSAISAFHFGGWRENRHIRCEKCRWHTRTMESRFTSWVYKRAGRAVEAHFTSGIDERTGTGSVRNAFSTLRCKKC